MYCSRTATYLDHQLVTAISTHARSSISALKLYSFATFGWQYCFGLRTPRPSSERCNRRTPRPVAMFQTVSSTSAGRRPATYLHTLQEGGFGTALLVRPLGLNIRSQRKTEECGAHGGYPSEIKYKHQRASATNWSALQTWETLHLRVRCYVGRRRPREMRHDA